MGAGDAGLLQQCLGALDVHVGVLGGAVVVGDRVVARSTHHGGERVAQLGVGVERRDEAIHDVLTGNRLQERLTDGECRRLVAVVGGGVERAAVVHHQVDVLVRAGVAGDHLDASIGQPFHRVSRSAVDCGWTMSTSSFCSACTAAVGSPMIR